MITLTGAIENGVATPDDLVDCQMGQIMVAGRLIHDWKKFGVLSVREILEHSSDVGAIKVALRLGAPQFYDAIRAFGIGQPTGIELPGENRGLLRPLENWSASSIGSLAMGQEVSVTPIQIISAISAVANGGTLYRPHIVREIDGGEPGALRPTPAPQQATDAQNRGDDARDDGGRGSRRNGQARAPGWLYGSGKIGHGAENRSGDGPLFGDAVQLIVRWFRAGEQSGDYDSCGARFAGGAASWRRKWAGLCSSGSRNRCWRICDVPHDVPAPSDVETAKNLQMTPRRDLRSDDAADAAQARFEAAVAKTKLPNSASVRRQLRLEMTSAIVVPSLAGQTVRGVTEECSRLGLMPSLIGSGVALEQFPEAGAQVVRGSRVTVRFGHPGEVVPVSAPGDGN